MSVANKITGNGMFVFVLVAFAVVILGGTTAMASYATAIYNALTASFEFLPIIAIVGALAYVSGRR